MKLFYSPTSPFARKVRMVAMAKGLDDAIELVTVNPMDDPAALHATNPLGKVPALILDDGAAVFDSAVICAHLDTVGRGPALIPAEPLARTAALTREALADGIMEAALALVMERRRPAEQQSPLWSARWTAAIRRALAVAAKAPLPKSLTDIGSIALACALAYLEFRLSDIKWLDDPAAQNLRGWSADISAQPNFKATAPP